MEQIQTFTLHLFSPPAPMSEDEQVELVMRLCQVLRDFDPAVSPAYEKAWSKKRAIPFDYSAERVREVIRRNVNREGRTRFPELGCAFGFFSSMSDDHMAGISFSVGAREWPGSNRFTLEFPIEPSVLRAEYPFTAERVWDLFVSCSRAFGRPQHGMVKNDANFRRFLPINREQGDLRPVTVHWMNYFGPEVLSAIGRERVEHLPTRFPDVYIEAYEDGLFLRLLDEPFDDTNPAHLERQKAVNRYLGLPGGSAVA